LDVGGVNDVIGRFLVEERRNLPNVSQYRGDVRERRKVLTTIGLAQVRNDEQRRDITSIESYIETVMTEVAADVTDTDELAVVRGEVRELLRNRRDLLAQAAGTYTSYLRALGDLDVAQRQLLDTADEYRVFLDQNLIWIPSNAPVNLATLNDLAAAATWLLAPQSWLDVVAVLVETLGAHPVRTLLAVFVVGGLLLSRRPMAKRYKEIDARLGRLSTDNIGLTLQAIALCALRALPLPLALWCAGWTLEHTPSPTEFTATAARSLSVIGPFLYNLLLFRVLCARDGVAQRHFDWKAQGIDIIRRQLDRLILIGTPLVAVTVLAYASPYPEFRDSLGRLAFVAFMLLFAIVIKPIGDPRNSVAANYYNKRPRNWVSRLKWVWYGIEIGGPLVLAVLALIGYLYTAVTLTGRFIDTIWLVLVIIVANLVVLRWLALARRKIEFQQALERREARRAEREKEAEEGEHEAEGDLPVFEPKPLDMEAVDQQTRRLLQTGLFFLGVLGAWAIWSDVLPALNILDEITLWSQIQSVDGADTSVPVTLADLLLALFVAMVTLVASRNLPGLMEIAVLQRIELEPGSRYTINTLLRYTVVTVGLISVFNIVGWDWSRIQWLVAALSVGLGFGLQEIVANFISGLIILFERPVRVGDTVTVGNLSGTVSRVRIRATTITDWDRKEIIVPNKSFITEQVVNWTLSDPITRVTIPVGISYGSDVDLAHQVMEETLRKQPLILDEPEPRAYFMGFGDSSLDFKLYMYSRQLGDRFPIMHAVHESIFKALKEHGIEIPFPQRDLHVRSVDEDAEFSLRDRQRDPKKRENKKSD
ncbi:MAG: mechanosensitive ion channel domain-containing protein, partial [Pseudomonadota bacterium]